MASQRAPLVTGGTSVPGFAPTRRTDPRAGVMTMLATGSRPVGTPLTVETAKVTSCRPGAPGSSTTCRLIFMVGSSTRLATGASGTRSITFSMRIRVTVICIPSVTGVEAAGTLVSRCINGAPAAASRAPTSGAARRTVLTTPPSLICTVLALTTPNAMPCSGTRLPREAAAGAVSVIDNWASASSTVDAVVHTCLGS